LIWGSEMNDESRNATVKSPGPPNMRAKPWSQVMKERTEVAVGSAISETPFPSHDWPLRCRGQ
jgi:hypothetical protein